MSSLRTPVSKTDHMQGDSATKCAFVEYGDYECPYCREAYTKVTRLRHHFGDKLLYIFRHFPLTNIHPYAEPAAKAAEFGGDHGVFWEMHDGLYENQERLGEPLFLRLADQLGLDSQELSERLTEGTYRHMVQADFNSGVRSGVNGTPTFFINDVRYDGSLDYDGIAAAVAEVIECAIES